MLAQALLSGSVCKNVTLKEYIKTKTNPSYVWAMDDNYTGSVVEEIAGNNGTPIGDPSQQQPPLTAYSLPTDKSFLINGSTQAIDTNLTVSSQASRTVLMTFEMTDFPEPQLLFSDGDYEGLTKRLHLGINTDYWAWIVSDGVEGYGNSDVHPHNLVVGEKYIVAYVIDVHDISIYVNGELSANFGIPTDTAPAAGVGDLMIGKDGSADLFYGNFYVDLFVVYDEALAQNTIQSISNIFKRGNVCDVSPSSPSSTLVAFRYGNSVSFYNTSDLSLSHTVSPLSCGSTELYDVNAGLEISPDNSFFLTSGSNGIGAYNLSDGTELYFFSTSNQQQGSISKDGKYITSASFRTIDIIDTTTWTSVLTLVNASVANNTITAWSHDGTKLAVGDVNGNVSIWNPITGASYSSNINIEYGSILGICFSPDDTMLAVSQSNQANHTHQLNVMTVQPVLVSEDIFSDDGPSGVYANGVVFSTDGLNIASLYKDNTFTVDNFSVGDWIKTGNTGATISDVNDMAISNGSTIIAVGTIGGEVILYNYPSLSVIDSTTITLSGGCYGVAWNHPS